jgi:hypothetical protein
MAGCTRCGVGWGRRARRARGRCWCERESGGRGGRRRASAGSTSSYDRAAQRGGRTWKMALASSRGLTWPAPPTRSTQPSGRPPMRTVRRCRSRCADPSAGCPLRCRVRRAPLCDPRRRAGAPRRRARAPWRRARPPGRCARSPGRAVPRVPRCAHGVVEVQWSWARITARSIYDGTTSRRRPVGSPDARWPGFDGGSSDAPIAPAHDGHVGGSQRRKRTCKWYTTCEYRNMICADSLCPRSVRGRARRQPAGRVRGQDVRLARARVPRAHGLARAQAADLRAKARDLAVHVRL